MAINMYIITKGVIDSGNYELNSILDKISTLWVKGSITDSQKTELETMARNKALPQNTYAPLQEQIDIIFKELKVLTERISALEGGEVPPSEEYPLFVQPTGTHDAYNTGDKVTFNDKRYECVIDNCVWSPEAYPQGWQLIN